MNTINLRQAAAIQQLLCDIIKSITFDINVTIDEFQEADTVIKNAQTILARNIERHDALLVTLYVIRDLVGDANLTFGISTLLGKLALCEKRIVHYDMLSCHLPQLDFDVITGKLGKIKTTEVTYSHNIDYVSTSVLDEDSLLTFKNIALQYGREKQQLKELILELNIKTKITLTDDVMGILHHEKLL